MKRIMLSLGLCGSLMMNTFAANTIKLNAQLAEILAPFQNETTQAQALFTNATTGKNHALQVEVNAALDKIGSEKKGFKLENLSYDFDDGIAPKTTYKGSIDLDLTKFVSQSELNEMMAQAALTLEQELQDFYLRQYGDAASANIMLTSTKMDSQGNYIGLSGVITFKIDLNKITDEKIIKEILITETVLSFNLNTKKGLSINGFSISNPRSGAFSKEEQGLKEYLLALELGQDDATSSIASVFSDLNGFFDSIPTVNVLKLIMATNHSRNKA